MFPLVLWIQLITGKLGPHLPDTFVVVGVRFPERGGGGTPAGPASSHIAPLPRHTAEPASTVQLLYTVRNFFFFLRICIYLSVLGLSCGARAQLIRGACMISVSQPGSEPKSPALEGRFLTTGPPGKSQKFLNRGA